MKALSALPCTGSWLEMLLTVYQRMEVLHTLLNFECALLELSTPIIYLDKMRMCFTLFFILQVTDSWVQDWEQD